MIHAPWLLALACLASWAVRAATPAVTPPRVQVYRVQLGKLVVGASRIVWQAQDGGLESDALLHIGAMLDQRQRLQLSVDGLPQRYRLDATVQGHRTAIDVRLQGKEIVETVTVNGQTTVTRLPCPTPVDWLDNNSFDTLQALLRRNLERLTPGTRIKVFVPQARGFGQLHIERATLRTPAQGRAESAQVLQLRASLKVGPTTVPIELDLDPHDATLLQYRQPQLKVSVTLVEGKVPVP